MLEIRIDLRDLRRFTKGLEHVGADIIEAAGVGLWEGTNIYIVPQAQAFAPVGKTGMLQSSIHAEWVSPMRVDIVSNVDYAGYQEFGFYHVRGGYDIEGKYFVGNAIKLGRPDVENLIVERINETIKGRR